MAPSRLANELLLSVFSHLELTADDFRRCPDRSSALSILVIDQDLRPHRDVARKMATLASACRVSRACCAMAQPFLYRSPQFFRKLEWFRPLL